MSDMERLAAIRARCEAATLGPWGYDGQHDEITADSPDAEDYWLIVSQCRTAPDAAPRDAFGHQYSADFAFIAHAREDVPYLLAEIDRLRSELEAAKATSTDRTKAGTWVRAGAVWLDMRHVAAVIAPLPGYEGGDVAVYGALTHDPDSANDWRIDFESAGEILAYVQEHQYRPA